MDPTQLVLSMVRQHAATSDGSSEDESDARLVVSVDLGARAPVSKHLFGLMIEHLGRCVYDGVWDSNALVPRPEVVEALRELHVPNIRWPGGCFADGYHWRDGIGPRANRLRRLNQHWGGGVEDNAFGTAEFLDLCEEIGCEPYIVGNVGSGTVAEMRDWLEYVTCPLATSLVELRQAHGRRAPWNVRMWGVGNEPWGCGGHMEVRTYAAEYQRYASFLQPAPDVPPLVRVACGANGHDTAWTEGMMSACKRLGAGGRVRFSMEALSLHMYCSVRPEKITGLEDGRAAQEAAWLTLLQKAADFDKVLHQHMTVMDRHDPQRQVGLYVDEWGVWYASPGSVVGQNAAPAANVDANAVDHTRKMSGTLGGSGDSCAAKRAESPPWTSPEALLEQPCTLRDGLLAALCLHSMIGGCERVRSANLAQAVNVLHTPLRTVGGALIRTPTFHVLQLLRCHAEGVCLDTRLAKSLPYTYGTFAVPRLSAVATEVEGSGIIQVSVVHIHPHAGLSLAIDIRGAAMVTSTAHLRVQHATLLTGAQLGVTECSPAPLAPADARMLSATKVRLQLPPRSLVVVTLGL